MPQTVNVHEAKTNFSRLLDRASGGEEIIVAKAGKPVARLMPLAPTPRAARQPGGLKGRLPDSFFDLLPDDELRLWNCEDE